jgi:membrane protein YqaA with SNARE-associated domain
MSTTPPPASTLPAAPAADSPAADSPAADSPAAGARAQPAPPAHLGLIRALTALAIVVAVLVVVAMPAWTDEFARYANTPLGLLLFFVLSIVGNATLVLPVSALALTPLVGASVHPLLAGLIGGSGQTIGELTGYLAGYSGQTLIPQDDPRYLALSRAMRRYGLTLLFVLGALPNPLFDVAGLTAGALRMPVWQFLVGTGLGKIAKNIAAAYLGALAAPYAQQIAEAVIEAVAALLAR